MFNRKAWIKKGFDFCPYCGHPTDSGNEDWGVLGKKDIQETNQFPNMFGGLSGKMLNKMLGGAMKMLEREMQKSIQTQNKSVKTNFELYINGKRIAPENIKVTRKPIKIQPKVKKYLSNEFGSQALKQFSVLEKEEPSTNIRRLSNKVIYEIDIPGVSSIENVSIVKLEKSIEIKAIAKDKAYKKIINIDLPILKYKLNKEKLILELGIKN